jgi:hypothetical protein
MAEVAGLARMSRTEALPRIVRSLPSEPLGARAAHASSLARARGAPRVARGEALERPRGSRRT